jgi:hypothetical protein
MQLSHTVNFAARIQNSASTTIGNIYVDNSRIYLYSISLIINGPSDDDAQISQIKKNICNNKHISFEAENQINRQ